MKIDMRDAFFNKLVEKATLDSNIIILSADHGAMALNEFALSHPSQYINIGISEQNMVGVASGLALSGKVVFIYGIAPFVSLRVLEQLTIDVAAMNLPVNVISVGAGFTYSTDGQTHLGVQDMAAIMTIPGISILNSSDPINTSDFVELCLENRNPHYIRIEKEKLASFDRKNSEYLEDGFSIIHDGGLDLLIITTGSISHSVSEIIQNLFGTQSSFPTHIDLHNIKPLYEEPLINLISRFNNLILIEESYQGALDSIVAKLCLQIGWKGASKSIYIKEMPIFIGTDRERLKDLQGLGNSNISSVITEFIHKNISK